MRKFKVLTLVFAAIFALSAVAASQAFAASKVLLNGGQAPIGTPAKVADELLLEDMGAVGKPDILCSGEFVFESVTAATGVLWNITAVLDLTGTLTAGAKGGDSVSCVSDNGTCTGAVTVEAINLPWETEIQLEGATYIDRLLNVAGKEPGYATDCKTILGLVEDTCTGETGAILANETGGILGEFSETNETITTPGNCSVGGAKQALLQGTGLITSTAGALTLSEE